MCNNVFCSIEAVSNADSIHDPLGSGPVLITVLIASERQGIDFFSPADVF